jgi:tellurite resistance protein TerC
MIRNAIDLTYRHARRVVVGIVGGTVLLIGLALVVLPGPAFVVIPIGLAILSLEFAWARAWLHRVRRSISARSLSPLGAPPDRD